MAEPQPLVPPRNDNTEGRKEEETSDIYQCKEKSPSREMHSEASLPVQLPSADDKTNLETLVPSIGKGGKEEERASIYDDLSSRGIYLAQEKPVENRQHPALVDATKSQAVCAPPPSASDPGRKEEESSTIYEELVSRGLYLAQKDPGVVGAKPETVAALGIADEERSSIYEDEERSSIYEDLASRGIYLGQKASFPAPQHPSVVKAEPQPVFPPSSSGEERRQEQRSYVYEDLSSVAHENPFPTRQLDPKAQTMVPSNGSGEVRNGERSVIYEDLSSRGMYLVQEESFLPRLRHRERRRRYRIPKEERQYINGIPEDRDVLFGRGGHFNTHPGNILFSLKALELISDYEEPHKMTTRDILIDYVSSIGGRFLTQDEKEKHSWFEADRESVKVKASQTLRDKKKDFSDPEKRDHKRRELVSKLR